MLSFSFTFMQQLLSSSDLVIILRCLMYSMYVGSHAFTLWGTFPPLYYMLEPGYILLLTTATFFVSFATCI